MTRPEYKRLEFSEDVYTFCLSLSSNNYEVAPVDIFYQRVDDLVCSQTPTLCKKILRCRISEYDKIHFELYDISDFPNMYYGDL